MRSGRFSVNQSHAPLEAREPVEERELSGDDRRERNQSDERADPDRLVGAVRPAEDVIEEPVLLVPEVEAFLADVVHGIGDVDEVLPEFARHVFVGRVLERELEGHAEEIEAVHRHPARPVRLPEDPARRELGVPIEEADVVEAEEASLEDVVPELVLAVHPPVEVEEQLVEDALEEDTVEAAGLVLLDLSHPDGGPGVDRRIDVAEGPLVRRDLAVRVHVPLPEHEHELVLRELRVDQREDDAVEGEVPGREPRELPRVRHRKHVAGVEVRPLPVAPAPPARGRRRLRGIAHEPAPDVVAVVLLRPDHARERLPHDPPLLRREDRRQDRLVVLVGLAARALHRHIEAPAERVARLRVLGGEAEAHPGFASGGHLEPLPGRRLGAAPARDGPRRAGRRSGMRERRPSRGASRSVSRRDARCSCRSR